jgi:opacity protein-like surface antigen
LQSDAIHYFLDYGVYYLYSSYKNNYLSQTSSGSVSYYDSDRYHSNGIGFGFGFGAEYALSKRVSIDAKMIASYSYSEKNGSNKGEQWDFRIGSTALGINFYW